MLALYIFQVQRFSLPLVYCTINRIQHLQEALAIHFNTSNTSTTLSRGMTTTFMLLLLLVCAYMIAAVQSVQLMWSASPLTPAYLSSPHNNKWLDVPATSVHIQLPNEALVLISYDVSVSRIRETREDKRPSGEENELAFRVVVDGAPYRQSAATVGDREPLVTTASGYLVLELVAGEYDVQLQWRKRGIDISLWAISSELLDGFAGGRSLVVSAQHRYLWHTQPLETASLVSLDAWEPVTDMTLHFRLSETATFRFFYQLPVRPKLVHFVRCALRVACVAASWC